MASTLALPLRCIWLILPYVLMGYLYFYVVVLQETLSRVIMANEATDLAVDARARSLSRGGGGLQRTEGASAMPGTISADSSSSKSSKFEDRLHTLESKLNAYLGFNSDPFLWTKKAVACKNSSMMREYCRTPEQTKSNCALIMPVCLDDFPYNDCIMYDFGIRTQAEFGIIFSKPPFNCQVFAFDPSPITRAWYENNIELKDNKNYHLYLYGGGGADETIILREYNWGQVSILSYPSKVVADPRNCTDGACRYQKFSPQKLHELPVRSVASIMKEFGHSRIDLLKIDVEGSEYRMLEGLIDSGMCDKIHQLTLEWHHYNYDTRYGPASVPHLNVFTKLLREKCGLAQFYLHDDVGWPANDELFIDMKLRLMYNIASFMKVVDAKA